MNTIAMIGLLILVIALVALAFRPPMIAPRFVDRDQDGEPDTLAGDPGRARALEDDAYTQREEPPARP